MSRNFYNLLESQCFLRQISWQTAWNEGIVKSWPALASPPACRPMGWKRARSLRLGERDLVLIVSSSIIAWILIKKLTHYASGLDQERLSMKSGKRSILQKYCVYLVGAASSRDYCGKTVLSSFIAAGSRSHKGRYPVKPKVSL